MGGLWIHLYGITRAFPMKNGAITGIANRRVVSVSVDRFQAIVSEHTEEELDPDNSMAEFQHHRVVREIFNQTNEMIPVRFGLKFGSSSSLRETLKHQSEIIQESLDRLHGMVEFGIKIRLGRMNGDSFLFADSSSSRDISLRFGPGTLYLKSHEGRESGSDSGLKNLLPVIRKAGNGKLVDFNWDFSKSGGQVMGNINILCRKQDAQNFVESLEQEFKSKGIRSFVITTPWPPWNFSTFDLPSAPM